MELNQYLEIFLEESKEHLQMLNEKLLLLEKNSSSIEVVNEIFRSAHTLKGMAATMGYENMATLTHEMENLLDLVRNKKKQVDDQMMDTIFKAVDLLEQMVISISNGQNDQFAISGVVDLLQAISSDKRSTPKLSSTADSQANIEHLSFDEYERTVLKQSLESGFTIYQIEVQISEETVLKSARAYMVFHGLEDLGEVLKAVPSVEELENEDFGNNFTIVLISKQDESAIRKKILNVSEISGVQLSIITDEQLQSTVERLKPADDHSEGNGPVEAKINLQQGKVHATKMIRVDIERLDELMNLFSELVIDRGRLEQLAQEIKHPGLTDTVEHMGRISSSLQNNILNLRMVPIETVFNRFPRMIRDLAKELNKEIIINITGAETELDRTVIDEIGDPLVHLLRNAVDHGQETTEERLKNNKTRAGVISLKAYHSGNFVFIEISDDGKGINREKVLKKALEKGLITTETAHSLTDKQVYDLLFASGLSTADQVSDISGRGVGLDVVKAKIESLGGFVTVDSELGKGTKFTIQLPLTLSIISSMLVRIQDEKFAIPLSSIIETAIYRKKEVMNAHNQEVIDFRGRIVPLVQLHKIFDVPSTSEQKAEEEISVVLVRKGEKMAGLIVDSFIGQQEIVLKALGSYLTQVFAISGATILGDGQVALIIDTNALIK